MKPSRVFSFLLLFFLLLGWGSEGGADWWNEGGVVAVKGCNEDGYCSGGSGCVIVHFGGVDGRGVMLTAAHVFDIGTECWMGIGREDPKFFPCEIFYINRELDIAIVRFSWHDGSIPPVKLLNPEELRFAEDVIAVGYPGEKWNLSVIRAKMWSYSREDGSMVVQTVENNFPSLSKLRGISGGALFARGRFIGVIIHAGLMPSKHAVIVGRPIKDVVAKILYELRAKDKELKNPYLLWR